VKAAPPFGFSNNALHSCRLSIAEKRGANNRQEQSKAPLFGMKFTQVTSQCSKGIGEVKATIKVWVRAKAPSCHVSRKSSAALRLFKQ
jgi:hypothetical protein